MPRCYLLKTTVPFGDVVLSTLDTCVGSEICEELWNPKRLVRACLSEAVIICHFTTLYFFSQCLNAV